MDTRPGMVIETDMVLIKPTIYDVNTSVSRDFLRKATFDLRKVYYISQQASLQFTTVQFITIHNRVLLHFIRQIDY